MPDLSVSPHIALSGLSDIVKSSNRMILRSKDRSLVSGEIQNLSQSILNLEAVESKLLDELSSIRQQLQTLRDQRLELESRIAAVWTLPNEILSHIFELGALQQQEEQTSAPTGGTPDETEQPDFQILVSHVSRLFREVAVHTPSLWSCVRLLDLLPRRLDYIRTFLERSGTSSLDIVLDCNDSYVNDLDSIDEVMALLVPHIPRLKRFTARFGGFEAMHHVIKNLKTPAPLLEALELNDIEYDKEFNELSAFEPAPLREPLTLFQGQIPKLSSLSLDGVHVAWDKCNFRGLYDVHLGYHTLDVRPSWPVFKAIIDASPSLTILDLRGSAPIISDDPTEASEYQRVQMESLMDMRISDISSDYAAKLISLLIAPNLQSLSLTNLDTNDYSLFLHRIGGPPGLFPNLESLKLSAIEANEDAVAALLCTSRKLKRLRLYVRDEQQHWLHQLAPSDADDAVLCPKLEVLRCVGIDATTIKDVLQKRKNAGVPIPQLEIEKNIVAWSNHKVMKWLRINANVDFVECSEYGTDDELSESGSDWDTENEDNFTQFAGIPVFSLTGFSDEDEGDDDDDDDEDENGNEALQVEEDDEDDSDMSEMEVDYAVGDDSSDEELS